MTWVLYTNTHTYNAKHFYQLSWRYSKTCEVTARTRSDWQMHVRRHIRTNIRSTQVANSCDYVSLITNGLEKMLSYFLKTIHNIKHNTFIFFFQRKIKENILQLFLYCGCACFSNKSKGIHYNDVIAVLCIIKEYYLLFQRINCQ